MYSTTHLTRVANTYYKQLLIVSTLFFSLLLSQNALANNNAEAMASVSKTRLSTNEVFTLQVVYMDAAHSEDFDPTVLDKEFTRGSVHFGSSRYSVNGQVTLRSEWNVSLATNKTGTVVIPSFEINGVKTDPITLHVTKDPSSPEQDDLIAFDDSISKTTLYPKEMATFTSRLLVKTDPRGLQETKLTPPSGEGLMITPVGQPNQFQKIINGLETTVVEQKYQVTAENSGTHTLIPTRLKATVISTSRATGARQIIPVDVQSAPINITVKEKPSNFHGVWLPTQSLALQQGWQDSEGNMLDASTEKLDVTVGQPITRILALVVQDISAESLPDIHIDYPNSVRVYSEKPKFGQDKSGNTVMTLKQVIMPKQSGEIELPSVSIPWWNSNADKAETAKASGIVLNAQRDENATSTTPAPPEPTQSSSTEDMTTSDNTNHNTSTNTVSTPSNLWVYSTVLFAILWVATLILFLQQKRKSGTQQTVTSAPLDSSDSSTTFIDAVKSKDGARIQAAFSQWQTQYPNIDNQLKQKIQSEMNDLMASLYGRTQQDYDIDYLVNLIKKAERQHKKTKDKQENGIAPL